MEPVLIAIKQFANILMWTTLIIGWLFLGAAISAFVITIKRAIFGRYSGEIGVNK